MLLHSSHLIRKHRAILKLLLEQWHRKALLFATKFIAIIENNKSLVQRDSMKFAATEVKAPGTYETTKFSIFLAGAIDQGSAEDWQKKVARSLDDLDILVLNPRRDDWDSSWEQVASNPDFKQQVMWEVTAMEDADLIIYVFTKDSKAPITFFEFGAFGTTKDAIMCAEDGFYRQGNLDIYCEHWDVPMYHNIDDMILDLHKTLEDQV